MYLQGPVYIECKSRRRMRLYRLYRVFFFICEPRISASLQNYRGLFDRFLTWWAHFSRLSRAILIHLGSCVCVAAVRGALSQPRPSISCLCVEACGDPEIERSILVTTTAWSHREPRRHACRRLYRTCYRALLEALVAAPLHCRSSVTRRG